MPMRIVNLKAASGGGGGTVVNSDTSGLFKFVHHSTADNHVNDQKGSEFTARRILIIRSPRRL